MGVFLSSHKGRKHKLKKKITEAWFREAYDHGFYMGKCNVFFAKFEKLMGKDDAIKIYKELDVNKNEDWFGNPEKKRNKFNNRGKGNSRNTCNGNNNTKSKNHSSKYKSNSTDTRKISNNFKRGNFKVKEQKP